MPESVKEKTEGEAKELITELRRKWEGDYYIRKVLAKARAMLAGAKKGKNVEL